MSQLTFPDVASLWKKDKRQYVKTASYAVCLQLCNNFLMPAFGSRMQLDEESIQSLANSMLSRGYAVKTVKGSLLVLKMILRFGRSSVV